MSSTFFVPARTWLLRISNSFLCVVTSRRTPANPQVLKRMTSATWAAVAGAVEEPIPALAVARAPRVPAGGVAPRPAAVPTRAVGNGAAPSGGGEGGPPVYRPRSGVRTALVVQAPSPALVALQSRMTAELVSPPTPPLSGGPRHRVEGRLGSEQLLRTEPRRFLSMGSVERG